MKKLILMIAMISATAFAGQSAGANGGTVGSDALDLAILKAAVNCELVGMALLDCDKDNEQTAARSVSQEIHRCQKLSDNLFYCLTTSPNQEVISTVETYAQEIYSSKNSIRDAFSVLGALPVQDKVGYINAWTRCQVAGIAPKDCQ